MNERRNTKHFDEQHPSLAKLSELTTAILAAEKRNDFVTCYLCGNPVNLEESATDEKGSAVHSTCYVKRLRA